MVDAADSKSVARKSVLVRVRPGAPRRSKGYSDDASLKMGLVFVMEAPWKHRTGIGSLQLSAERDRECDPGYVVPRRLPQAQPSHFNEVALARFGGAHNFRST
jgi:hypothetical protein